VYAHLAHPSSHVRTPQLFNAAFAARGDDVVAVSIDVDPAGLAVLVDGLRAWRNLAGFGITMPHKEALAALVDDTVGDAARIGAINNVRREPDGRLIGRNTDGEGFLAGLRREGHEVAGRDALLIGAGGAGRALAFALAEAGVGRLTIANRSRARAEQLAADVARAHAAPTAAGPPDPAGHDLVVNATSLGLQPDDPLPVDPERLESGTLVAEIVMTPGETPLMRAAAERGCRVHPGLPMLECQIELVRSFLELERPS
jgi:shikimate dehydrogenase